MQGYVGVYILSAPYAIDRVYDYAVPSSFSLSVRRGSLVAVPFGKANRREYALVTEVRKETSTEGRLKSVLTVLPTRYALSEEMCDLALFLSDHTLCTVGEAVHALMPAGVFSGIRETFFLPEHGSLPVGEEALAALFADGKGVTQETAERMLGGSAAKKLLRYTAEGYLYSEAVPAPPHSIQRKKLYSVKDAADAARILEGSGAIKLRSAAQKALVREALRIGEASAETLLAAAEVSSSVLHGLVKKGVFSVCEIEEQRNPYAGYGQGKRDPVVLSRAQGEAYDTLSALLSAEKPHAALLYGVTGSGKTKVMIKLIDRALSEGRTAIMLVPEIALTPQTVEIFCARYGERVAVLHSSLTTGERFDAWRRIKDGEVDLVVGTRSAIFAPLENIGLILIDEEHEHTYKSDQNPKYHTRDVAAFRAKAHNALTVFASATPAVESFYKASVGIYTLVPLRERFGGVTLPETEVIDMREELRKGNRSPIGERLLSHLEDTLENEEQSILFLNRRGYNSAVTCHSCGEALTCPHCSVALTYHIAEGGYLLCHLCGHKSFLPRVCPDCGSQHLSYVGCGTEKAETELHRLLPYSRVLRMDADTTGNRKQYESILSSFRNGEADILLGTQMVTKGHDFPHVSLVGVVLADASLRIQDFRASERTFALITQVVGRAGRRERRGRAVIQTYAPENPVIRLAARQDYDGFYMQEIASRRALRYPPFCDMVQITLSSENERELLASASRLPEEMKSALQSYPDLPLEAFGPFEAQTYKVGNKYRMRMILKCRAGSALRAFLRLLLVKSERRGKVTVSIDINPSYI